MKTPKPHEKICGAKTRSGGQCQKSPMSNGRCKLHGGKTPSGIESPNFKTGLRSKHLPTHLAAMYQQAQVDPETGSLLHNIALHEAFVREQMESLKDGGDSAQAWADMSKEYDRIFKAYHNADPANMELGLKKMSKIIESRDRYHQTIGEIQTTLAEQRKDLQALSQIELRGEQAVSVKELMTFVAAVMNIIKENVTDKQQRVNIANQIDKIISLEDRQTANGRIAAG